MSATHPDRGSRVDAHVHVWPQGSNVDRDASVESAATALATASVDAAVLIQPSFLGLDHTYLEWATLKGFPAVAVAQVEPGANAESLTSLATLLGRDSFAGFRLPVLRGGVEWLRESWPAYAELAAAHDAVVCLLVGPDQLAAIDDAAEGAPSISLVVDHLGRPDLAREPERAIADLCALAVRPNVHVKVSALGAVGAGCSATFIGDAIRATLDAFGPERVLWGSDYPFTDGLDSYRESPELVAVALAEREPDVRARVLGGNARRLFFR